MKKLFLLTATMLVLTSWSYYRFAQFDSKLALEHQLKQIISSHDVVKMSALSIDEPTKDFLLQLPTNSMPERTSDFQGGYLKDGEGIGYFVTNVGNTKLSVYMKEDTRSAFHKLFPKWGLFKVSIASTGLPSIRDLLLNRNDN